MGEKFDKLNKQEQEAVKGWARHEAILYSATVKNFGSNERAARADAQAEKVAADPKQVKRIVDAVTSKACQDDQFTYILKGTNYEDEKKIMMAVDLKQTRLPEFARDPRACTAEDIELSSRAISKKDFPNKTR